MTEQEISKAYMTNEQLGASELERIKKELSETMRLLQLTTLIPGAKELAEKDQAAFHAAYGLENLDTDIIRYFYDTELISALGALSEREYLEAVPERVFRYKQFLSNKLMWRKNMLEKFAVPDNPRMKKWRQRQINRCMNLAGSAYECNVHFPMIFELNDGCSVGCPFCAAGARKLQRVFRHTPENAKLFREILYAAKEVIGTAVACGALYYACEPLDNPDYELFAEDFYRISGRYPQMTTAAALRDTERTGRILNRLLESPDTIHRFSMFSKEDVLKVLNTYTPEQLLMVELIGQYEDAPSFSGFASAGRARDNEEVKKGEAVFDSVCCVSGFVVNLPCKTVRLITAVNASERYPMGEIQYETASFIDAEDFKNQLIRMIEQYMPRTCPMDLPLRMYPEFRIESIDGCTLLRTDAMGYDLDALSAWNAKEVIEAMMNKTYTAPELVSSMHREHGIAPESVRWVLELLWQRGVIDEIYP